MSQEILLNPMNFPNLSHGNLEELTAPLDKFVQKIEVGEFKIKELIVPPEGFEYDDSIRTVNIFALIENKEGKEFIRSMLKHN